MEEIKAAILEYQEARKAYDEAIVAWVNATIEPEKNLFDRLRAAEDRILHIVLE